VSATQRLLEGIDNQWVLQHADKRRVPVRQIYGAGDLVPTRRLGRVQYVANAGVHHEFAFGCSGTGYANRPECKLPLADVGALVHLRMGGQLEAASLGVLGHPLQVLLKEALIEDEGGSSKVVLGEPGEVAPGDARLDFGIIESVLCLASTIRRIQP